jgi:hypothetical protein
MNSFFKESLLPAIPYWGAFQEGDGQGYSLLKKRVHYVGVE